MRTGWPRGGLRGRESLRCHPRASEPPSPPNAPDLALHNGPLARGGAFGIDGVDWGEAGGYFWRGLDGEGACGEGEDGDGGGGVEGKVGR